jgi:hypothetical protein
MNANLFKLASAINECDKHIKRIFSAYSELKKIIPLQEKAYENLNDDDVRLLDQFIFRFSKLQDTMGQRLFPALLISLEEDIRSLPYIDILNRIETLGLISSKDEWLYLRRLQNEFSHEYSNNTKENAETINNLIGRIEFIYSTFTKIKNYSLTKKKNLKEISICSKPHYFQIDYKTLFFFRKFINEIFH